MYKIGSRVRVTVVREGVIEQVWPAARTGGKDEYFIKDIGIVQDPQEGQTFEVLEENTSTGWHMAVADTGDEFPVWVRSDGQVATSSNPFAPLIDRDSITSLKPISLYERDTNEQIV